MRVGGRGERIGGPGQNCEVEVIRRANANFQTVRWLSTHRSSVVLELAVAAECPGAVYEPVPLAVLGVQQTLLVEATLGLPSLPVDLCHDVLDHADLERNETTFDIHTSVSGS